MNRTQARDTSGWRFAPLACVLALLAAPPAAAQSAGEAAKGPASPLASSVLSHDETGHVVVRATRVTQRIRIDGRLDDAAYREVTPISELIQQVPDAGAPVSERTELWVMFDDENVYVACRCWDEHPERMVANDMRRDSSNLSQNDNFAVEFDTFHDRRNGFLFFITPAGGMRDALVTDETTNFDWNGVWDGRASRFDRGWIAEMALPFKSLRYKPGKGQTWGIQIRRQMVGKNELAFITPTSPARGTGAINQMSVAATLVGLEAPPAALNLEIKPYGISSLTTDLLSRPAVRNDLHPEAGVDVKYGVTKSLTADFTYNTDFAQVEADEAQINLTRFSLMFPEKREFFLEGQGLFTFGAGGADIRSSDAPIIFYSRRIGLSGGRAVPVIAGGRLNGRAGPWSVGTLNMETGDDAAAGAVQTNFTVLRLRRDILRRSNVGGVFTRRSVSTVAPGAPGDPGGNDVWGLDTNFAFYQNVYVSGYLAQSRTDTLHGDDLAYRAQFNYTADRYGLAFDRNVVEKNFNPEVGFLRRENFRRTYGQARFSPRTKNNRLVRKFTSQANLDYVTDNENHVESRTLGTLFQTDFQNSDAISFQFLRLYEFVPASFEISQDVFIPIGGYSFDNAITAYSPGAQRRVAGDASFETGSFYGGTKKTAAFRGRVNVSSQLGVEPNISLNWIDLPQGRFTTTVVGGRTTFTMTPRMFVAGLVQYSSSSTSLSTNLRFRWEYQPGSELFVVYTEGRSTFPPSGTDLQNRGIVVKMNHLFRF